MDRNLWWKRLGMGTPEVLPEKLSEIGFLVNYSSEGNTLARPQGIVVYHYLLGKLIGFFVHENVEAAYYAGRVFSFLLFLCSLGIISATFLKLEANQNIKFPSLLFGFLFVLFLPQFLILSVSVHPDALSVFLSSLFFFAAYPILLGCKKTHHFVLLIFSAGAGFFTDRSTFFLVLMTLLIPFFLMNKKNFKKCTVLCLAFAALILTLSFIIIQFFPLHVENSFNLIINVVRKGILATPRLFSLDELSQRFVLLAADSFFFRFGWLAFGAGPVIDFIWRLFSLFSLAGLVTYLGKFSYSRYKKELLNFGSSAELKLILFSGVGVGIQFIGLWIFFGINGCLAQGRHFFPLLLPIAFLFSAGINTFLALFIERADWPF
jgi:hypothetical protein